MNINETITVLTGLLNTLSTLKDKEIDVNSLIEHTKSSIDKTLTSLDLWIG